MSSELYAQPGQDDKTRFRVNKIKVTGFTALPEETLRGIVEPHEGKDLSLADLRRIADEITRAYRERGFLLAFAYVPAQEVKEGVVEIAVLEGQVARVVVEGNRYYSSEYVQRYFRPLESGPILSQESLERALLLLNEHLKLNAHATLKPGEKAGSTEVHVRVEDEYPLALSTDYDNFGSDAISEHRFGLSLQWGDLLNRGQEFTLRLLHGDQGDNLRLIRLGYEIPASENGLRINLSFAFMSFKAEGGILTALEPNGEGPLYSLGLRYPFVKTRALSLLFEAAFEGRDLRQLFDEVRVSFDHMRVLSFALTLDASDDWNGRNVITFQLREGLGDFLHGTAESDAPSRAQASNAFDKLVLHLLRIQKIADDTFLLARWSGQYCTRPLLVSEQFGLGGPDSVRGYHNFEFAADWGYSTGIELRMAPPGLADIPDPLTDKRFGDIVQLAAFFDYGEAGLQRPQPGQRDRASMYGAGVGLRLNYPRLSVRFDVGFPLAKLRPFDGKDLVYYLQIASPFH